MLLRLALSGHLQPLFGNALWSEYQDVLGRPVWGDTTTSVERQQVLSEADNHLIELALAGGAMAIVTHNLRDLRHGELHLGNLRVMTPAQCVEEFQ